MSNNRQATAAMLTEELRRAEERRFKHTGMKPPAGLENRFIIYYMEKLMLEDGIALYQSSEEGDDEFESKDDGDDYSSMFSDDGDAIMFEDITPEPRTERAGQPEALRDSTSDSPKRSCCDRIKDKVVSAFWGTPPKKAGHDDDLVDDEVKRESSVTRDLESQPLLAGSTKPKKQSVPGPIPEEVKTFDLKPTDLRNFHPLPKVTRKSRRDWPDKREDERTRVRSSNPTPALLF